MAHILNTMVRVEKCCHSVEKVLVLVKVLLLANQVQFELAANVLIFQGLIVANVLHQLVEHSVGVLASEHPLGWVPLCIAHSVRPSRV